MMKKILVKGIFLLYDKISGGNIKANYKLIKAKHQAEEIIHQNRINEYLLLHGLKGTLEDQPLMTKADISKNMQFVDVDKVHSFAYTGGSYGEPFKIPYSKKRSIIRTASFKYFNEAAGYQLGDPFMLIAAKEKPKWWQYLRNEYRFVPRSLTEDQISCSVALIVRKKIKVLIGFPSVIFELASFIKENKVRHQIKTVVFTSEPIGNLKRGYIKDALACNVIDRYSNEEVGLIAQQKQFGSAYYTNRNNIVVELLNDNLKPVKEGEMGKVVVTDLEADLVPIVRYDTGDLAIAQEYRNGQLFALSSISGRVTEQLFTTEGTPIAPLVLGPLIHMPLSNAGYYPQFQFAQVAEHKYELRIKQGWNLPSTILEEISANLRNVLGHGAVIDNLFVEDIKPQPSGKRPIYKNEMR